MWSRLELGWFKCFERLDLPLSRLTLLSGRNASGKSTIIQSLTLLAQTLLDGEHGEVLVLDGSLCSLGTAADVAAELYAQGRFSIALSSEDGTCRWTFKLVDKQDTVVPMDEVHWQATGKSEPVVLTSGPLFPEDLQHERGFKSLRESLLGLTYLSAERLGPRETYPLGSEKQFNRVGARGERAPGLLHWYDLESVADGLRREEAPAVLCRQVEAWMRHFFPGLSMIVERVPGANLVRLSIRTSDATSFHRPQHVGYGITHILPIVTACLHARPGDVLLIENPEVHLHPWGQYEMGRFLARTAAAGAQVVLETHSDHVLNGIRIAVREKIIAPSLVALHFFGNLDADDAFPGPFVTPVLDQNGRIDRRPVGFFDQWDEALRVLLLPPRR